MASFTLHYSLFVIKLIIFVFIFERNLYANAWVLPKKSFSVAHKLSYFSPIQRKESHSHQALSYEPLVEYGLTDLTTLGMTSQVRLSSCYPNRPFLRTSITSWNIWFRKKVIDTYYKNKSFVFSVQPLLFIPIPYRFLQKNTISKEIKLLGGCGTSSGFSEIGTAYVTSSFQKEYKGEATLGIKFGYNWMTMVQLFTKKIVFNHTHPHNPRKKLYQTDIQLSFVQRTTHHKGLQIGYVYEIKKKKWNPHHGFILSLWSGF